MSVLSQQSKKVNWNKLLVKGATGHLRKVAKDLNLTWDEANSLTYAISKIEILMTNKLAEDYEAFKATELFERGNKK